MKKYLFLLVALMVMFVFPSFAQDTKESATDSGIWVFIISNIEFISAGLISLLTMLFGGKMLIVKKKFTQLLDLLNEIQKALKDGKVDKEELEEIIKDMKALLGKADKK